MESISSYMFFFASYLIYFFFLKKSQAMSSSSSISAVRSDAEKRASWHLPADHAFIEPLWSEMGNGPVFVTPVSFSYSTIRKCWVTKDDSGHTKCFHGILKILESTFYPHSNFAAIRRVRKAKQDRQSAIGLDASILRICPLVTPVPATQAVSIESEQSGLQAGREVDNQIRDVVNLYNKAELDFKYTYLRFTQNTQYLESIRAFAVHMPDRVFGQLNPIVQFWLYEMCRRRWRFLQSQGGVFHEGLRIATAFDVIAFDQATGALLLFENKNSGSSYFEIGAKPMLEPFTDKMDSALNKAQLQAKFTAFLIECVYSVHIEKVYVLRTQLGLFQPYPLESWVDERFDQALSVVRTHVQKLYDIRKMDKEPKAAKEPLGMEDEDDEDSEGEPEDREYHAVQRTSRRGGVSGGRSEDTSRGRRDGRGGRGGRGRGGGRRGGEGEGGGGRGGRQNDVHVHMDGMGIIINNTGPSSFYDTR